MKYSLIILLSLTFLVSCASDEFNEQIIGPENIQELNNETIYLERLMPEGLFKNRESAVLPAIQTILDTIRDQKKTVVFPDIRILIDNPKGIRLYSNLKLDLSKTTFIVSPKLRQDGQILFGQDVSNIEITGGTFIGNRDQLPISTNIAGIVLTGNVRNISIRGTKFQDLTSNGIRIHGTSANLKAEAITIAGVSILNSCNEYIDYLLPNAGPVDGTSIIDQGLIALFFVNNFSIDNCNFSNSKSDGTHFYKSSNGIISNTSINNNKMGGLFIEGCTNVDSYSITASGNGSRGVTIERGSIKCDLYGSTVTLSGREAVWIDDSEQMAVSRNIFTNNAQKAHWPYNSTIRISDTSWPDRRNESLSKNILISSNQITSLSSNYHAVWAVSSSSNVVIRNNEMLGANRRIKCDSWISGYGSGTEYENKNWSTSTKGSFRITPNFKTFYIEFPHQLDIHDWDVTDFVFFQYQKIGVGVQLDKLDPQIEIITGYDRKIVKLRLNNIPSTLLNKEIVVNWQTKMVYPK